MVKRSETRRRRPPVVAPDRPMVVAHRGASSAVAEHTLDAYVQAIESGADAVECDVRLTRDGHLVCVHDRTVNRTSDGRGVVSTLELERLKQLDFASWHEGTSADSSAGSDSADDLVGDAGDPYAGYLSGVEPDRVRPDGGVLTLQRLLELVHDSGPHIRILIETKHPTRYAGLVEKQLVDQLRTFGWASEPVDDLEVALHAPPDMTSRVVLMSFAMTAVKRVKLLSPSTPTVLLMDRLSPGRRVGLNSGATIAGPSLKLLHQDPDYVARAHARGYPVYVWTVDEPDDITFVRTLGVDAIISNRPAEAIGLLNRL